MTFTVSPPFCSATFSQSSLRVTAAAPAISKESSSVFLSNNVKEDMVRKCIHQTQKSEFTPTSAEKLAPTDGLWMRYAVFDCEYSQSVRDSKCQLMQDSFVRSASSHHSYHFIENCHWPRCVVSSFFRCHRVREYGMVSFLHSLCFCPVFYARVNIGFVRHSSSSCDVISVTPNAVPYCTHTSTPPPRLRSTRTWSNNKKRERRIIINF